MALRGDTGSAAGRRHHPLSDTRDVLRSPQINGIEEKLKCAMRLRSERHFGREQKQFASADGRLRDGDAVEQCSMELRPIW